MKSKITITAILLLAIIANSTTICAMDSQTAKGLPPKKRWREESEGQELNVSTSSTAPLPPKKRKREESSTELLPPKKQKRMPKNPFDENKSLICPVGGCLYHNTSLTNLMYHLGSSYKNHTNSQKYKCNQCTYAVAKKSTLIAHMKKKHEVFFGTQDYNNYIEDLRIHDLDQKKNHPCVKCHKTFKTEEAKKIHSYNFCPKKNPDRDKKVKQINAGETFQREKIKKLI